jgi:hypothetical protein
MEELRLTVNEAAETLILSPSSVYNWIERGKLDIDDSTGEKIIVISPKKAEEIRERNLKSKRVKNSNKFQEITEDFQENTVNNVVNSNNDKDILQEIIKSDQLELIKYVAELSSKAGKYELLEDKQRESNQVISDWQGKYFESQYDYKKLQENYSNLQQENEKLKNKKQFKIWAISIIILFLGLVISLIFINKKGINTDYKVENKKVNNATTQTIQVNKNLSKPLKVVKYD